MKNSKMTKAIESEEGACIIEAIRNDVELFNPAEVDIDNSDEIVGQQFKARKTAYRYMTDILDRLGNY